MARGSAELAVGAGAAIVAALVGLWLIWGRDAREVAQGQDGAQEAPARLVSESEVADPPANAAVGDVPEAEAATPPRLDVVRVDAGGLATIAGSAPPGATVSLRLNGVEIGQAKADAAGQFASLLTLEPSDAPRLLGLVLMLADGSEVVGEDLVALAPVAAPVQETLVEEAPVAQAPVEEATVGSTSEAEATSEADVQIVIETPPVLSSPPAALLLTPEGVTVLQDGSAVGQDLPLSIASISYGAGGEVVLGGKANSGAALRIYLNDVAVTETRADAQGTWRATLADVAEGVHRLRADQIGADGAVQSRFETPFKREVAPQAPSVLAGSQGAADKEQAAPAPASTVSDAPAAEPTPLGAPEPDPAPTAAAAPITITVQPGLTLWAIARDNFGEGMMYVQVFEANRDKIKDPDLIYPGQVFTVPKP